MDARLRAALPIGAVLGMVAGAVFAMFEMVSAWLMDDAFWMPLRMIGAILLGDDALEPSYSLASAALTGGTLHMLLSAMFGMTFAAAVAVVPALGATRARVVTAATTFGIALWLVNFYVIAPIAFPWFSDADPIIQFIAHAFLYGSLLGLLVATSRLAVTARSRPQLTGSV